MQIKRVSTRVALIVFGIVFKLPALRQMTTHGLRFHYMRNEIANASEFATYILCNKASFLAPVFSLGFVSISRFESGEKPTWEELREIFRKLPPDAQKLLRYMSRHPFTPQNFRRSSTGLKMIDFGDGFGERYPLSYFLRRFHKEFEEVLKEVQTAAMK